jgi:hypothetical protein
MLAMSQPRAKLVSEDSVPWIVSPALVPYVVAIAIPPSTTILSVFEETVSCRSDH